MGRVAHGQVFEVTRHRQPIARLIPMRPIGPVSPWPDLDARAHNVFRRGPCEPWGLADRDRRSRLTVTTYVDSSALVSVYVPERFSKAARGVLRAVPQVPFTQLRELEVPNAFELLVGAA